MTSTSVAATAGHPAPSQTTPEQMDADLTEILG
jgi:hypothetical protein